MSEGDIFGGTAIAVVAIIFVASIAKLWIREYYANQKRKLESDGELGIEDLARLTEVAKNLGERVEAMEAILKREVPDWSTKIEN